MSDDAAMANWGGSWRMPTDGEWTELIINCIWTWNTQGGKNGYKVSSKTNGSSIYLPAAGYRRGGALFSDGSNGSYRSSSLTSDYPSYSWFLIFISTSRGTNYGGSRFDGFSVRPVYGNPVRVTSISLNKTQLSLNVGESEQLTATVLPSNAGEKGVNWSSNNPSVASVNSLGLVTAQQAGTATITVTTIDGGYTTSCSITVNKKIVTVTGVSLSPTSVTLTEGDNYQLSATVSPSNATDKSVTWLSNNTSVATVSSSGVVTAKKAGSATITVKTNDGGKTATCSVTVTASSSGQEAVDLGLPSGIKWGSCNIGASKPEDYGDYYAWGETETKSCYYWSTYKFRISGYTWKDVKFSKYITTSYYGTVDSKTMLEPTDDVAHVKLGGKWWIPTDAEWTELRENCFWIWTTRNGVNGRLVTSKKNGNSIFLPAAGYRVDTYLWDAGSCGLYWSSSLDTYFPYRAWGFYCNSSNFSGSVDDRYHGRSVRPVSY